MSVIRWEFGWSQSSPASSLLVAFHILCFFLRKYFNKMPSLAFCLHKFLEQHNHHKHCVVLVCLPLVEWVIFSMQVKQWQFWGSEGDSMLVECGELLLVWEMDIAWTERSFTYIWICLRYMSNSGDLTHNITLHSIRMKCFFLHLNILAFI